MIGCQSADQDLKFRQSRQGLIFRSSLYCCQQKSRSLSNIQNSCSSSGPHDIRKTDKQKLHGILDCYDRYGIRKPAPIHKNKAIPAYSGLETPLRFPLEFSGTDLPESTLGPPRRSLRAPPTPSRPRPEITSSAQAALHRSAVIR